MATHGGARKGAGRKAKTGQAMIVKRVPVEIIPEIDQLINQLNNRVLIQETPYIPTDAFQIAYDLSDIKIPLATEKIPAGFPSPAEPYASDFLDFNQYLIKNPAATIAVRCGGESMLDAGIDKNNLLIIDRSLSPSNHDIVMADLGSEYTIKRLHILASGKIELHSENALQQYPNFSFKEGDELFIVGVITHVIKDIKK